MLISAKLYAAMLVACFPLSNARTLRTDIFFVKRTTFFVFACLLYLGCVPALKVPFRATIDEHSQPTW